jgi:hypothetical protein
MRLRLAALSLLALPLACGGPREIPPAGGTCTAPTTSLAAGNASGVLCGNVTAAGSITVKAGDTLELQAGTVLAMPEGANLHVDGTLTVSGTKDAPVQITSSGAWGGIDNAGTLNVSFAKITGQDAAFSQSTGTATFTDVTLDLLNPVVGPDCTSINGGAVTLDHTRFTGCHCSIHLNAGTTLTVTNSILDGSSDSIMMTAVKAEVHHSNLTSLGAQLYDLGGSIDADVSGNFYGGGAPSISSGDPGQFKNASTFATAAFTDVGPRF